MKFITVIVLWRTRGWCRHGLSKLPTDKGGGEGGGISKNLCNRVCAKGY